MNNDDFVDYYELLEVSSNANLETIEKVFRYLARKFHPDNAETGDAQKCAVLVDAYSHLSDPEKRAAYDLKYERFHRKVVEVVSGTGNAEVDALEREKLLHLFYSQRRQDMKKPGVGAATLETIMNCPQQVMDFHIWYLREKGWISREEKTGLFAITVAGVEKVESSVQQSAGNSLRLGYTPGAPTENGEIIGI